MQKVTVSTVDLNDIKTSLDGAFRRIDESLLNALDAVFRELLGLREALRVRDRAWRNNFVWPSILIHSGRCFERKPGCDCRSLAPCVRKLYADLLVLRVRESHDLLKLAQLFVVPEAQIFGCNSTFWTDGGRFYKGEARTT